MDKFDLFHLVSAYARHQWFLEEHLLYRPTLYTLIASPVNNIIINKNQQTTINAKTIKLLNDSANNLLTSNMDQINC